MFEGKEVEGAIGDVGGYSVDLDEKGLVIIEAHAAKVGEGYEVNSKQELKLDLLGLLEKLAKKTETPLDDVVVDYIKKMTAPKVA